MPEDEPSDGVYRLESGSIRRSFLRTLAVSGTGLASIKSATQDAFGEEPDGVPIVWRRDRFGNPETINYVPRERRRRIKVYENLPSDTFRKRSDAVNGFTLRQQSDDPADLALEVHVNQDKWSVRRGLPSRVQGIPVVVEKEKTNVEPVGCEVCDRRDLNFYDPLPANPRVTGVDSSGSSFGSGTLGFVGWNSDPNSPYKCYIAADHVVDEGGSRAPYLQHQGDDGSGTNRKEKVGSLITYSPFDSTGMDVAKYKRRSNTVTADLRGNADSHLGDVAGTWTFSGLSDAVANGSTVDAEFAGLITCYLATTCFDTERTATVDYQAFFNEELCPHDSGGPYLDNSDFLIGFASATGAGETVGPTAEEALDRLNVQLFDPRLSS